MAFFARNGQLLWRVGLVCFFDDIVLIIAWSMGVSTKSALHPLHLAHQFENKSKIHLNALVVKCTYRTSQRSTNLFTCLLFTKNSIENSSVQRSHTYSSFGVIITRGLKVS